MRKDDILKLRDYACNVRPDNYPHFLSILAFEMDCKVIVELGVRHLITTNMLAKACPEAIVIGIDIDDGYFDNARHGNINLIHGDSIKTASSIHGEIDLLFIDAEHTYENTMGNYNAWKGFVKNGGIIVFDDTNSPSEFPELLRIKEEIPDFIELNELHHSGFGCVINNK